MPFVNPLDRLPQIPGSWANHIAYGGALGLVILATFAALDLPHPEEFAAQAVLCIASLKKLVDYLREGESIEVCVGKALVTAVWPASIAIVVAVVN